MTIDDLDTELRTDAVLWREQIDGLRPDLTATRARPARRIAPLLGGLAAAAVVLAAAILVMLLRHDGPTRHIQAGNPAPVAPTVRKVPTSARCSDPTAGQSNFGASLAIGATGSHTVAGAVRAAKFGPRDITRWHVAARNTHAELLLSGPRFMHVTRLGDHTWFVDTGGKCTGGTAILP